MPGQSPKTTRTIIDDDLCPAVASGSIDLDTAVITGEGMTMAGRLVPAPLSLLRFSSTLVRGRGRPLLYATALTLVLTMFEVISRPAPAVSAPPDTPARQECPVDRPDRASAALAARWCGGRVEVAGERSETLRLWANADGTLTAEQHTGPVRMRDGKGGWQPVDFNLHTGADGSVSAKAHPRGLRLAGAGDGAERELVTLGSGEDAVALLWSGRLPKPTVSGTRATYADVLDGVDLVIEATRTGYEEFFVVKNREALARSGKLALRLKTPARTVVPDGSGGLLFKAKDGKDAGRIPEPSMWDATVGAQSLDHLRVGKVGMSATQRGANVELELTPDPAFLAAADLKFPVTIDPSIYPMFDTFVQSGYTSDQSGSTDLKLGFSNDGGSWTARSFINWDTGFLAGSQVTSANVYLWNYHSWSCTAMQWEVWLTGAVGTGTRWTSQPGWTSLHGTSTQTRGFSAACNDGWVSAPATGLFQAGASNGWPQTTMGLKASNETSNLSWKRFHSSEAANDPYAVVTFNSAPQVTAQSTDPSTPCTVGAGRPYISTLTPKLRAQLADPEGSPVSATFEWWTTGGSIIGSTTVGPQASSTTFEASIPSGVLSNAGTYSWRVRGTDGGATGPYSAWCEFTTDTVAPGDSPIVWTVPEFPEGGWTGSPYSATTQTGVAYVDGTTVLPLTGDDNNTSIVLPFPITFYGRTYTSAWIDTNGHVDFVDPQGSRSGCSGLPSQQQPNGAVCAFAQDLIVDASASVRTAVLGTAPNRRFVVDWNNVTHYSFSDFRISGEVIFNESGTDITFNYKGGLDTDVERGRFATVGLENADGTSALRYSHNEVVLADNKAITFRHGPGTPPTLAPGTTTFRIERSYTDDADLVSYVYGIDSNPPTTVVDRVPGSTTITDVNLTGITDGPHTFYIRSLDRAGNQSPLGTYRFNVGYGGITSPRANDISAGKVALEAAANPVVTGVTYEWRRADTDAWTTIPAADVTVAAGGAPVTWPVPPSGGAIPKLNWNLEATVNNAEPGPDALDGPVQVRAVFASATGGAGTTPLKISLDRDQASAASVSIGPGSANLLTGNYTVGDADVSVASYGSDLTVTRNYNSRRATATDKANMFGPGWVSGVVVSTAESPYTSLTVVGSLVQIGTPDGDTIGFTEKTASSNGKTYEAENGFQPLRLSYSTASNSFTLSDAEGNTVLFTQVAGAAAGSYNPSAVTTPGLNQTTTLSWQKVSVNGVDVVRPTRMLAPVPSGVSCGTLVRGCRALDFTYASATTATGTGANQWGDVLGRVREISFTAWDPDAGPPAMRTVVLSRYSYDSNGRLRAVWDPRLDWSDTSVTPPVNRSMLRTYDYDADGILRTITPAGGQQPWQLTYTTIPGDPGKGRLAQVSRSALSAGTAHHTIVYRVPVSGAGAPYNFIAAETNRWGQIEQPVDATAVYGPAQVPTGNQATGTLPSSYERADVAYLDANGRSTNTLTPGGHLSTNWYDRHGNLVGELTAGNRKRALDTSASDAATAEAAIAASLSTRQVYSVDGLRLQEVWGPEHEAVLPNGTIVRGRSATRYTYDQGAPATGGSYDLVTAETTGLCHSSAACQLVDTRTTTTGYDWSLRRPISSTVDPGGLALTTRNVYDPNTGLLVSTTEPAGGTSTNTPATRRVVYYRAGTGSGYTECDSRPEWANLPCRVQPGGQAATGPELPVRVATYNMFNLPTTFVEKTSTGVIRTATTNYDNAGRAVTMSTVGAAGTGTSIPTVRDVYDRATGQRIRTEALDTGNNVIARVIRGYDSLGRLISYTDADGTISTTAYDLLSRVASTSDGQATRTYAYDGGSERRGLLTQVTDGQAGAISVDYDADGQIVGQNWANGVVVSLTMRETGSASSIRYTKPGCGQPDCTIYTETGRVSVHGHVRDQASTLSSQRYGYDNAARLTTVNSTEAGSCSTRLYGFDAASNRTRLTTFAAAANGVCQSTTPASDTSWGYDTANRTSSGSYVYDVLGRITTAPGTDSANPAGGNVTLSYHVSDLVRSITQAGRTTTYTLDAAAARIRSWTDAGAAGTASRTNHYSDDSDRPAWTDEGSGGITRTIAGVTGIVAIYNSSTGVGWQLTNLHGDLVAGMVGSAVVYSDYSEYGQPRNTSDVGSRRYGWLGASQRAADTPGGLTLMGARVYAPGAGRFLQVDPVQGGSANAYEYCRGDAVNCTDTSGTVSCYRTGSWTAWYTIYKWHYFRCNASNWEVWTVIYATALYGAFATLVGAAVLFIGAICALLGNVPCGVALAVIGGAAALWGALWLFIAGLGSFTYWYKCRSQRGVYITGYYVTFKWSSRPLWGRVTGRGCR
jgi:RHS repeat-associated protein